MSVLLAVLLVAVVLMFAFLTVPDCVIDIRNFRRERKGDHTSADEEGERMAALVADTIRFGQKTTIPSMGSVVIALPHLVEGWVDSAEAGRTDAAWYGAALMTSGRLWAITLTGIEPDDPYGAVVTVSHGGTVIERSIWR